MTCRGELNVHVNLLVLTLGLPSFHGLLAFLMLTGQDEDFW